MQKIKDIILIILRYIRAIIIAFLGFIFSIFTKKDNSKKETIKSVKNNNINTKNSNIPSNSNNTYIEPNTLVDKHHTTNIELTEEDLKIIIITIFCDELEIKEVEITEEQDKFIDDLNKEILPIINDKIRNNKLKNDEELTEEITEKLKEKLEEVLIYEEEIKPIKTVITPPIKDKVITFTNYKNNVKPKPDNTPKESVKPTILEDKQEVLIKEINSDNKPKADNDNTLINTPQIITKTPTKEIPNLINDNIKDTPLIKDETPIKLIVNNEIKPQEPVHVDNIKPIIIPVPVITNEFSKNDNKEVTPTDIFPNDIPSNVNITPIKTINENVEIKNTVIETPNTTNPTANEEEITINNINSNDSKYNEENSSNTQNKNNVDIREDKIDDTSDNKAQIIYDTINIEIDVTSIKEDIKFEIEKEELEDKNYDYLENKINTLLDNINYLKKKNLNEKDRTILNNKEQELLDIKKKLISNKEQAINNEIIMLDENLEMADLNKLEIELKKLHIENQISLNEHLLNKIEDLDKKTKHDEDIIATTLLKERIRKAYLTMEISSFLAFPFIRNKYFRFFTVSLFVNRHLNFFGSILRKQTLNYEELDKTLINGYDALENAISLTNENLEYLNYLENEAMTKYPTLILDHEYLAYINSLRNKLIKNQEKLQKKKDTIYKYNIKMPRKVRKLKRRVFKGSSYQNY